MSEGGGMLKQSAPQFPLFVLSLFGSNVVFQPLHSRLRFHCRSHQPFLSKQHESKAPPHQCLGCCRNCFSSSNLANKNIIVSCRCVFFLRHAVRNRTKSQIKCLFIDKYFFSLFYHRVYYRRAPRFEPSLYSIRTRPPCRKN